MNGWTTKKLGEVCTFRRGLTYSKGDEVEHSSKVVLRANNISLEKNQLCFDELKFIRDDFEIPDDKYLEKDCVLICTASGSKAHLGKVAYIDKEYDFAFGGFMGLIVPDVSLVFSRYFYYVLTAENYRQFIQRLTDGANINNLKFSQLAEFDIPIPPLAEQKRIVAKIDAAFEKIDRLKANAEKNLANAKELFQSALDEAMRPKKGWVEKRLGEVCEGKLSYGTSSPSCAYDSQVRYIRITDIDDNGKLLEDLVSPRQYEQKHVLEEGDVVFARTGATVGKSYLYSHSDGKCVYAGYLIRARVNQAEVLPKFLFDFTKTSCYKHYIQVSQAAAAQPNVNAEKYGNLIIPLPSLREQRQIVETIENVWEISLKLQQNYARQIADCAEMRQAILREAFEGRL